jgi:hypothetical protein
MFVTHNEILIEIKGNDGGNFRGSGASVVKIGEIAIFNAGNIANLSFH